MAIEGGDVFARLDAHCLPAMRAEFKRLLVLNVYMTVKEIARKDHANESTIKAWLRIARAEVAMALEHDDDLTPGLCGYWVARHSGDCLKETVAQVRRER